jgi:L-lactate dehydrogenase complex protein LldG
VSARTHILERVRQAVQSRPATAHPGAFEGWRPGTPEGTPIDRLQAMLETAGAEVVRVESMVEAGKWVRRFANDFDSVTLGVTVPSELRPTISTRGSHEAALGISMASGAIAETGSLMMDARDGRRTQLLAPTHVVFVRESHVHARFRDALLAARGDLPSAIGLHAGPSKSADIAQTLVTGVHGPGRFIAVLVGGEA